MFSKTSYLNITIVLLLFVFLGGCTHTERIRDMQAAGKCKARKDCIQIINTAEERLEALSKASTPGEFADRITYHALLGHRPQALRDFETVVETNYEPIFGMYEQIQRAMLSEGWDYEATYAKGWEFYQKKLYSEAAITFKHLITYGFGLPGVHFGYGLALCELGQCAEGRRNLEKASKLSPSVMRFHLGWALVVMKAAQQDTSLLKLDSGLFDWDGLDRTTPENARAYLLRGEVYFMGGHHAKAIRDYGLAIGSGGAGSSEGYPARAKAYLVLNQYREALSDLNQSIQRFPKNAEYYFLRGSIYFASGGGMNALKDFQQAVELNPKLYAASVVQKCDELTQSAPREAEVYFVRGLALIAINKRDDAIGSFSESVKLRPNHGEAFFGRATAYHELTRYTEALADYDQVLRIDSSNQSAHFNEGLIYLHLFQESKGQNREYFRQAEQHFDRAALEKGKLAYYKAVLYGSAGTMDTLNMAINFCEVALKIDPKNGNYRRMMNTLVESRSQKQFDGWMKLLGLATLGMIMSDLDRPPSDPGSKPYHNDIAEELQRQNQAYHNRALESLWGLPYGALGPW